jgi:hypothetical protein
MRRNTRLLFLFGIMWFGGIMFYVRQNHQNARNRHIKKHEKSHPRPTHEKIDKSIFWVFLVIQKCDARW